MVEYNGKKSIFVDGKNAFLSGLSSGDINRPDIQGLGGSLTDTTDGTSWGILFYDKVENFKKNTGNITKLFDAGEHDYLLLGRKYEIIGNRGVVVSTDTPIKEVPGTSDGNTTQIQKDDRPRKFQVEKAYFYNTTSDNTSDRFIWVEGTFDTWMNNNKKAEGEFRIQVQVDLQ